MKPGYKTTEFWLTLVVVLLGALLASGALGEGHVIMKVAALAVAGLKAMGYDAARAKTKYGANLEAAAKENPPPA